MDPFGRAYSYRYAQQADESDGLSDVHSRRVSVYEVEIA
jgi:hypothetical protein